MHAHRKPASAPGVQSGCTAAARATRPPIECPTSSTGGAASPPARVYNDARCCSAPTTNAVCRSSKKPAQTKCVSAAGAERQRHALRAVQARQLLRKVHGVPVQHAPLPRRGGVVLLGCLGRQRARLRRRAHAQPRPPCESPPRHAPACSCRRCRARTGRARPRGAARSAHLQRGALVSARAAHPRARSHRRTGPGRFRVRVQRVRPVLRAVRQRASSLSAATQAHSDQACRTAATAATPGACRTGTCSSCGTRSAPAPALACAGAGGEQQRRRRAQQADAPSSAHTAATTAATPHTIPGVAVRFSERMLPPLSPVGSGAHICTALLVAGSRRPARVTPACVTVRDMRAKRRGEGRAKCKQWRFRDERLTTRFVARDRIA